MDFCRQSYYNTQRLLNVLHIKQDASDHALLSLDAEKASDRIKQNHLLKTLTKFAFGEKYIHWIKLLYIEPQIKISTISYQNPSVSVDPHAKVSIIPLIMCLLLII